MSTEFLGMPFGLSNLLPIISQKLINIVFQDLIRSGLVLTYLDEIKSILRMLWF